MGACWPQNHRLADPLAGPLHLSPPFLHGLPRWAPPRVNRNALLQLLRVATRPTQSKEPKPAGCNKHCHDPHCVPPVTSWPGRHRRPRPRPPPGRSSENGVMPLLCAAQGWELGGARLAPWVLAQGAKCWVRLTQSSTQTGAGAGALIGQPGARRCTLTPEHKPPCTDLSLQATGSRTGLCDRRRPTAARRRGAKLRPSRPRFSHSFPRGPEATVGEHRQRGGRLGPPARRAQDGPWQCADTGRSVLVRGGRLHPPGDDAGHAVLTVAGAVEAQAGQKVKQVR